MERKNYLGNERVNGEEAEVGKRWKCEVRRWCGNVRRGWKKGDKMQNGREIRSVGTEGG